MTDLMYEEIVKAIHKCKDKTQFGDVCSLMCLPCRRVIDSGKCPLIIEMVKEKNMAKGIAELVEDFKVLHPKAYARIYNQALEDIKKYILNSCNNVTCREDINADNDFDFYASELLDMLEEMKK